MKNRGSAVHQAAEGWHYIRQQRAGIHHAAEGQQYIRQQRAGSISKSMRVGSTSGSRGPAVYSIRQQRTGSTSGSRGSTVHEAAEGWHTSIRQH